MAGPINNGGNNFGKKLGNVAKKVRGRADNGKNFDVMDPTASNPNAEKAKKNAAKIGKKALKLVGKLLKKLLEALLKAGWVGLIILAVIIIVVIITAINTMPGMMRAKLAELFKINVGSWFMNGATASLKADYSDIIDVANYIESMNYSLIGDGFVTPNLRDSEDIKTISEMFDEHPEYPYKSGTDGKMHFYYEEFSLDGLDENAAKALDESKRIPMRYYDNLGRIIINSTGEVEDTGKEYRDEFGIIRSTEPREAGSGTNRGKVVRVAEDGQKNYRLLRTYLLSNYRIYTLKNADEGFLVKVGNLFSTVFGGNQDAWAKGLIKLYIAEGGKATDHWWWGSGSIGDTAVMSENELTLKKGLFNQPMSFSIEGWSPRYGLSLDFLLSLHLGTGAPDLVYAMLQNFDIEIQVYLDDSGDSKVDSRFVDPSESGMPPVAGDSLEKVKGSLSKAGFDFTAWIINDYGAVEWMNPIFLTKKACQVLLTDPELTFTSPDSCTGAGIADIIDKSTYDTSSNYFNDYNITKDKDPEIYEVFSDYEGYEFQMDNGSNLTFDMKNCSQKIGTGDYEYEEPDFTWWPAIAYEYGLDSSKRQPPTTTEFEIYKQTSAASATKKGDVYRVRKIKNYNVWVGTRDGEELEYEWYAYKYLIYKVGTYVMEVDHWEGSDDPDDPGEIAVYGEKQITYSGYEEWVDTFIVEFFIRDKTTAEAIATGIATVDEDGNTVYNLDQGKCSEQVLVDSDTGEITLLKSKCCPNCQRYIKAAVAALAEISDQNYSAYTPYIARVVGSWFRDTYFIIPEEPDDAINEYAGKTAIEPMVYEKKDEKGNVVYREEETPQVAVNRPEFDMKNTYNSGVAIFVEVDEEYLGDSGEYWTSYETKGEGGDYQLYVLRADGITSKTTMEEFLKTGEIDDSPAKINGNTLGRNPYGPATSEEEIVAAKEKAEEAGWAFVKKAVVIDVKDFAQEHNIWREQSSSDRINDKEILWSAYSFDSEGAITPWARVGRSDDKPKVNALYDIIYPDEEDLNSGIFYQISTSNNVAQVEDAQRGETNALVKYLFKYRKYYLYDGGENTALAIAHDKQRILYGYQSYVNEGYDHEDRFYNNKVIADKNAIKDVNLYDTDLSDANFYHYRGLLDSPGNGNNGVLSRLYGNDWKKDVKNQLNLYGRSALRQSYAWGTLGVTLNDEDLALQWFDWQLDMFYMDKYGVDLEEYYDTSKDLLELSFDPRDPDLVGTVQITKSSLNVFSILENTGSLDADYAYRDFKELIVELDYFDKEDLSTKIQSVFTWVLPTISPAGWPVRPWDKLNVDYGTLIESNATYRALGSVAGGTSGSSVGSVNESTVFWIGDSWIMQLGIDDAVSSNRSPGGTTSDLIGGTDLKKNYFYGLGGKNAIDAINSYSTLKSQIEAQSEVSAIAVGFGLNATSGDGNTQALIEKLHEDFPNIQLYALKASHVGENYHYLDKDEFNKQVDGYNQRMQSWCEGSGYCSFVDWSTNGVWDAKGYLLDADTAEGLHFQFGSSAKKSWYNNILAGMSGGSTGGSSFQGYVEGDAVVSPVTGKILEIGTHERLNVYSGEMEEVEYITIQVMDTSDYFKKRIGSISETDAEQKYGYKTETEYSLADALDLFYKEYSDVCTQNGEGYTITIDGFDVDLLCLGEDEDISSLTNEEIKDKLNDGAYSQNEVHALYNSEQEKIRKEREQAKDDAPFFINRYETEMYPTGDYIGDPTTIKGYYIKEGKYLGRAIEPNAKGEEETAETPEIPSYPGAVAPTAPTPTDDSEETSTPTAVVEDKLTYTYADFVGVPGDYIRIVIHDTDYALVDDVERFFDIPELVNAGGNGQKAFTGKMSEEFLYWMLVHMEGGLAHLDSSGQNCVVFDIGDGMYSLSFGVTNACKSYFLELGYDSDIPNKSDTYCGWQVGVTKIPVDHVRDVAIAFIDSRIAELQSTYGSHAASEGQLAALMSVVYNFGSVPTRLKDAILSDSPDLQNIWEHLSDSQADRYPGLVKRRVAEYKLYSTGTWTNIQSGDEMHFKSSTPFSDYMSTRERQDY